MAEQVKIRHNNPSTSLSIVTLRSGDIVEFDAECKTKVDKEMADRIKQSGEDIEVLGNKSREGKKEDLSSQAQQSESLQGQGQSSNKGEPSGEEESSEEEGETESSYTKSQLNEMKVDQLQEIAKGAELPEEEWKSLKKGELVDYILSHV